MTETTRTDDSSLETDVESQPWPACRLSRLIGKSSECWTVDDLVEVVARLGIRLVSLMHVGGDGWLKALDFVPRDLPHLREVLSFGERADGSSLFGTMGVQVTASDVVLRPRIYVNNIVNWLLVDLATEGRLCSSRSYTAATVAGWKWCARNLG